MTYLIAEIGINHNGSAEIAEKLIVAAKRGGADAVKFQYRSILRGISLESREIGDEILDVEIKKNYLAPKELIRLTTYAQNMGLGVGVSFFDETDIQDFGDEINLFDFFKIPSVEFQNKKLIKKLLIYGKQVLVSSGCCSEEDIENFAMEFKGENCVLFHCVSNYPVEVHNANIGYIKWLKDQYRFPVGYSSHDANYLMCIAALAFEIDYLERHITLSKSSLGLDHSSSSTEEEFLTLSYFCKNAKFLSKGNKSRTINPGELLNLQNLGRSFYAKKEMHVNERIEASKFEYRTPRLGLGYRDFHASIGLALKAEIKSAEVLGRNHLEAPLRVAPEAIDFCINNCIGLPVRLHDVEEIMQLMPLKDFELHLSFGEVLSKLDFFKIEKNCRYSIHLPDYINSTTLIDPFSLDITTKIQSKKILDKVINLALQIEDKTSHHVPVVGSFSVHNNNAANFYNNLIEMLTAYKLSTGIQVLPQWLPPIAWYFGGSVFLDVFNDSNAINLISTHSLPYCLDTSHLFMCVNGGSIELNQVDKNIFPLSEHFHISGASGLDGEGRNLSNFSVAEALFLKKIIASNKRKIIEVWQGHLEGYRGFQTAINDIYYFDSANYLDN